MCGSKGKKIQKLISESKTDLAIKKISFASPEGKELCAEAVFKKGVKAMPFFTDGKKFSTRFEDFIEKDEEKPKKTRKNVKKSQKRIVKKKGDNNEPNQ